MANFLDINNILIPKIMPAKGVEKTNKNSYTMRLLKGSIRMIEDK